MKYVTLMLTLILWVSAPLVGVIVQQKPAPTITEDMATLEGRWRTPKEEPAKLELTFKKTENPTLKYSSFKFLEVKITYEGSLGKASCNGGCTCRLMEDGKRRSLVFGSEILIVSNLPQTWYYRFEGKQLVLNVEQGKYKGEYKLERISD